MAFLQYVVESAELALVEQVFDVRRAGFLDNLGVRTPHNIAFVHNDPVRLLSAIALLPLQEEVRELPFVLQLNHRTELVVDGIFHFVSKDVEIMTGNRMIKEAVRIPIYQLERRKQNDDAKEATEGLPDEI